MGRIRRKAKGETPQTAAITPRGLAAEIMSAGRNGRERHYFDAIAEILLEWLLDEPTEPSTKQESRAGANSMVPNPDHRWPTSGMVRALNRAQELNSMPDAQLLGLPERLKYDEPMIIRFALMDVEHAIRRYTHVDRLRSHSPYFTVKGVDKYCAAKPL